MCHYSGGKERGMGRIVAVLPVRLAGLLVSGQVFLRRVERSKADSMIMVNVEVAILYACSDC
jgi:hypothetical protein